jgi:hypothetical protein
MQDRESFGPELADCYGCRGQAFRAPSLMVPLSHQPTINFTDRQLHECYHGNLAEGCDFPNEVRPVYALITAHNLFRLLEGPHSARAHEAIQHLLLPKLRAALVHWYRCFGDDANLEASEFRKHLSRLSGEKL